MFKVLSEELKKYMSIIPSRPIENNLLYDGITAEVNIKKKLYAKDFNCPTCKGTACAPVIDNGEEPGEYLTCLNNDCITRVAQLSRKTSYVSQCERHTKGY